MNRFLLALAMILLVAPAAFSTAIAETQTDMGPQTIVEVAEADGRFTTLLAALDAANLTDTLNGDGPFTVFAPTDGAFSMLPAGTVEGLLNDIPTLTEILTYHVVAGDVRAADVVNLPYANTIQGQPLMVDTSNGVMVGGAQVIITDIEASNGVIHVIDTVLVPPQQNIVEIAVENGSFSTLVAAVQAAGLVDVLTGEGPFTVFAPTDEAFSKLPAGTVESLLADIPTLQSILTYHVVAGRVLSADVVTVDSAPSVQGSQIAVSVEDGAVMLNDSATVIAVDILGSNGVIHVIDSVILPPQ